MRPEGRPLNVFVCGPTVYGDAHIGHARTYVVFDSFVKFLRAVGFEVFYLQNITDIDDKIIAKARQLGVDWKSISEKYTKENFEDFERLSITAVDEYAKATNFIPEIVEQVKVLLTKGVAYEIMGDGIYFDVSTFPDYGKLSRRTIAQAEDSMSRIDESVGKKNKADFTLWKFSKLGEPAWDSEIGAGRPGWHIEDTAISEKFFGPQYDLHGGGIDLKFPHHEAEIAQQESASGRKPFVKIWMHTGSLTVNGEKMSKSLNNFVTIKKFLSLSSSNVLRLLILSSHYRSPIDYTEGLLSDIVSKWLTVLGFLARIEMLKNNGAKNVPRIASLERVREQFFTELSKDFNTPKAIAVIFSFIREVNVKIWEVGSDEAGDLKALLNECLGILGLKALFEEAGHEVTELIKAREEFRENKQFAQADGLRKKINDLGFELEDTPLGPLVWRELKEN